MCARRCIFIFVVLFIVVAFPAFAANNFSFGILWATNRAEQTTVEIKTYDGENACTEKVLDITDSLQNTCKIYFTTNKSGTHSLYYYATPLINGTHKAGFELRFSYNGNETVLAVGNSAELYPDTGSDLVSTTITVPSSASGETSAVIDVKTRLTQLDYMIAGTYSASIYIYQLCLCSNCSIRSLCIRPCSSRQS